MNVYQLSLITFLLGGITGLLFRVCALLGDIRRELQILNHHSTSPSNSPVSIFGMRKVN